MIRCSTHAVAHAAALAGALALAACGGAKTPTADSSAAVPAPAIQASQMPAPDTMKADTAKQAKTDSAAKAAAVKAAKAAKPSGDYDRVRRPIGTIDEKTGKVDTVRKP